MAPGFVFTLKTTRNIGTTGNVNVSKPRTLKPWQETPYNTFCATLLSVAIFLHVLIPHILISAQMFKCDYLTLFVGGGGYIRQSRRIHNK